MSAATRGSYALVGTVVATGLAVTSVVAASARIPLTSVTVPFTELGTRAVHLLVRKLSGTPIPQTTLLPPHPTERTSTAPRTEARTET
ncbi:substrate-binding domain-containing protein [Streptomyces sp. NPDC058632]|uniref:substrate-binding domain-containing protein n=1 Tax=Streptomyces sp. NPDC058632 TaxID=3346567 RepID=UPI0036617D88